jgi:lipopolysaccharide export system permease protein
LYLGYDAVPLKFCSIFKLKETFGLLPSRYGGDRIKMGTMRFMTIIQKHLIKELLQYFCTVLITVVGIYVAVEFFGKIDNFLEARLPISRALAFFGLRIPFIVAQTTPVGLLLAVLIVFGLMVNNNEIVALKSSGVSIFYLFKPVLAVGLIFSALLFFLSEVLVPITIARANKIWNSEVKKESAVTSREKNIWIKGNRSISHITYFKPSDETIFGVTLNYFDAGFRLTKRIDAQKGVYTGRGWDLFNVVEQDLVKDDRSYKVTYRAKSPAKLDFVPEDLKVVAKKGEEMSYSELSAYIREVEQEGYDATSHRVDLSAKIAFPLVCVIMVIVGSSLAFWRKRKEGIAGNIFCGLGMAFLYWTLYSFCLSLGYGGVLPPVIVSWLTNVLFACVGTLMLLNTN